MPGPPPDFWDARYAEPALAYGDAPNDFLAAVADRIAFNSRVLCLAEGQGRNAVWLAEQGHAVTAVDRSAVGLARAEALATARGVEIETVVADLADFDPGEAAWDAVVSVFAHLPTDVRRPLHRRVVAALRPGGMFILEAYTPAQTERDTGGPSGPEAVDITMTAAGLADELAGLDAEILHEAERAVVEGPYHRGDAAVVQMLAWKPG
ncbi:SAM-dependent methyltransferase [Rubrivirga sp. IMCC43871]|uniref:SAM-dependent methyltransferase n=1 Tax=Rubrivirga sp. IMCC43871 TaxID=3391575 RepID=UPI00399013B1